MDPGTPLSAITQEKNGGKQKCNGNHVCMRYLTEREGVALQPGEGVATPSPLFPVTVCPWLPGSHGSKDHPQHCAGSAAVV